MTTKQWTGQGGTNAANVTTANSGGASGDAFDSITLGGSGTLTYSNTNPPLAGYMSARAQAAAGGSNRVRWYHTFPASNYISRRYAFRMRQDPAGAQVLADIVASDFTFPIQLQLVTVSGARHLQLKDAAGGLLKDWSTLTYGSATTDIYYLDLYVVKGTTASNGIIRAKLYDETLTLVGTELNAPGDAAYNTGTLQYVRTQWGGNAGVLMDMDVWAIKSNNDSPGGYVGLPTVANTAPTGYMMDRPDPFEPGTVTVTATLDDSDGTISATPTAPLVSIISGPNFPTVSHAYTGLNTAHCVVTATFTAQASARYLCRLSGYDNAGAAVTAAPTKSLDVYIDTYATTGDVNVYAITSSTGYTAVGAGSVLTAVTDADDASYAETAAAPSAAELRTEMCAYRINRPIKAKVRGYRDPSGGAAITVTPKLYAHDNTTLVETGPPFTLSSSVAETVVTFAGTSLTTKASRRDLIVCLSATQ